MTGSPIPGTETPYIDPLTGNFYSGVSGTYALSDVAFKMP
jgi:hypothetical protein